MTLTLQAASARRHPRVPRDNERLIIWVLAAPPLTDRSGRFLRVVIDADGATCWPGWRRAYCDSVELMSPEQYPPRTIDVADPPRTVCAKCGRPFRHSANRSIHERACGQASPRTIAGYRAECGDGIGYWGKRQRGTPKVLVATVLLLALAGCCPPALVLSGPGNELQRAQDRAWAESVTARVNALVHCVDVQTRECVIEDVRKQKEVQ